VKAIDGFERHVQLDVSREQVYRACLGCACCVRSGFRSADSSSLRLAQIRRLEGWLRESALDGALVPKTQRLISSPERRKAADTASATVPRRARSRDPKRPVRQRPKLFLVSENKSLGRRQCVDYRSPLIASCAPRACTTCDVSGRPARRFSWRLSRSVKVVGMRTSNFISSLSGADVPAADLPCRTTAGRRASSAIGKKML
jgi:hypothetical protein